MTDTPTAPRVYTAIAAVMAELAKAGISKDRSNQQQGYKFRGIDDVYNALSPALSMHNLCMLPRILSREVTERTTQKGNALFYVVVEAEFDLIATEDGSKHTIRTYGEAMDSADKATNKAMSAAYKYAAMQAFAIPTEGDNDADTTMHDVAPREKEEPKQLVKVSREAEKQMRQEVDACATVQELKTLWNSKLFQAEFKKLQPVYQQGLIDMIDDRTKDLTEHPVNIPHRADIEPDFDKLPA
jgi:hypothetical protein